LNKRVLFFGSLFSCILLILVPNISAIEYNNVIDSQKSDLIEKISNLKTKIINHKLTDYNIDNNLSIWIVITIILLLISGSWTYPKIVEAFLKNGGVIGRLIWSLGFLILMPLTLYGILKVDSYLSFGMGVLEDVDNIYYFFVVLSSMYIDIFKNAEFLNIFNTYAGSFMKLFWLLGTILLKIINIICLAEYYDFIDLDGNETPAIK